MSELLSGYHFQVNWGGTRIGFQRVSGLKIRTEVMEYRNGTSPTYSPEKIPGQIHYSNIRFTRGVARADNDFFEWWNTMQLNQIEKRDLTISLLNEEHEPILIWKVKNAFPVSIEWDNLDASESNIYLEYLEIANEGIVVETP